MIVNNFLKLLAQSLPENPGVYQYLDADKNLIYVGKAKNLKKRVSSYFNKEQEGKTKVLVSKIAEIKHIVVDTEFDALLLENNLIKKYRPRYNVMLKDDKTYPWICIKNEPFPRIFYTRNPIKDGSQYFGPYPSLRMMQTLLELIRKIYPLRNCTLNLLEENIAKKKYKVCLEYHIKNCKGPCVGKISEAEYLQNIAEIKQIIKGNISQVLKELRQRMMKFAENLQFEEAQATKEKLSALEGYQSKSTVFSNTLQDVDVFAIIKSEETFYVNFFKVMDGAVVQIHTLEIKSRLDEKPEDILSLAIVDIRQRFQSKASEIVVPFELLLKVPKTTLTVPKVGEKKSLLELAERNLKFYLLEKQKHQNLVDPERHSKRILSQMKADLALPVLPMYIECFDNSNIQGDYPVAAMTVMKNAKLSPKDYRHFNIKTVEGANDFASMEEVIYRRYSRLLAENSELPQLIIVDGGKGQLSAAMKSLKKLGLSEKIHLIGIAERLEEIYRPGDPHPLHLDKKSETLKMIQQLRDEAHRFGITHYRKKHEKGLIKTKLTDIKGIGETLAVKLLHHFHSVKNIRQASFEEIESVVGTAKAKIIQDYFSQNV
ncbi:MAG: excinuclease ABC subunit UvrC [Bacteroidales bacterium]|jgi:excinuclease ABC subunit C|nr:excinuclease ABC subunit UvrC [Bacteroidales bacterium]